MQPTDHSLRRRLLTRLWFPLAGVLLVGAFVSYALAVHFAKSVHDKWLLDSAMTLAAQVRHDTQGASLELPITAVEMFEWDNVDRIYDEVISPHGARVFGNAIFPKPPASLAPGEPRYYDNVIDGNPVRVVAISVRGPADIAGAAIIQVAETMRKRDALAWDIMLVVIPLQTIILLVAAGLIWFGVTSSLASLDETAGRLVGYDADNLVPVLDLKSAPAEIKPLIDALNGLILKVADSRAAQQRFVANAAHQLRTPLAALQLHTERALRETNPDRHAEALDHVLNAVRRMRHLTHQLLMMTRSDSSSGNVRTMVDLDLAELARDELERWTEAAIRKEVDLGYEGPEGGPAVHGEPQLLRALIGNLVDNAIRYGRTGGEVTLGVRDNPTTIFVEDDGPGIELAERERVLDPFYRSPKASGDGCGLGLAIAREIAVRHGASLSITEHVPQGTRVEVVFARG